MRPLLVLLCLLLAGFLSPGHGHADDSQVGRYRIIQGDMVILLDTVTGKTWRFSEPLEWHPMNFRQAGDEKLTPDGDKSAIERWQEDAESRRLKLLPPGEGDGG